MGELDETKEARDARVGYQVAASIMLHEEQQMWSRSNAMLVANGIIIAAMGMALIEMIKPGDFWASKSVLLAAILLLGVTGWRICKLWQRLVGRTSKKCQCWVESADELEFFLRPTVQTLEYGKELSRCGCVEIGSNPRIKMTESEHSVKIKEIADLIAGTFSVVYIALPSLGCLGFLFWSAEHLGYV